MSSIGERMAMTALYIRADPWRLPAPLIESVFSAFLALFLASTATTVNVLHATWGSAATTLHGINLQLSIAVVLVLGYIAHLRVPNFTYSKRVAIAALAITDLWVFMLALHASATVLSHVDCQLPDDGRMTGREKASCAYFGVTYPVHEELAVSLADVIVYWFITAFYCLISIWQIITWVSVYIWITAQLKAQRESRGTDADSLV